MAYRLDSMMMAAQKMRHATAMSKAGSAMMTTTTKTKTTKTGR